MPTHVSSGPANVIAHGTVTTFRGDPLLLQVEQDDIDLRVRLSFEDDPTNDEPSVRSEPDSEALSLCLINFGSTDGRGSAQPVLLSETQTDLLFFHFRVFRYGQTEDHTVHYTFYRVAKRDVGWRHTKGGGTSEPAR